MNSCWRPSAIWLAHLAEGGSAYIFHADTEGLNFRRAFKEAGFHISGVCIWVKNSLVLGRSPYQWQHEPVQFGWLPNGKHKWFADRKQSTIWNFDKPKKSAQHPTMKPIPLLAYPIKNSSAPNGVVMDLFSAAAAPRSSPASRPTASAARWSLTPNMPVSSCSVHRTDRQR